MSCYRTTVAIRTAATIISLVAAEVTPAASCFASPEDAARSFVQLAIDEPRSSVGVLDPKSLSRFRARLEQLLDDRYSPMSAAFRDRLFSPESNLSRVRTLTDIEFVGQYLAAGQRRGAKVSVADISMVSTSTDRYLGTEVTLRYLAKTSAGESVQQRTFSAASSSGCWRLDVPVEAWARLDQLAKGFKEARQNYIPTHGRSQVRLLVARASDSPGPEMQLLRRRGERSSSVWVSTTPLLTEAEIVGARASWDCEAGLGPEDASVMLHFADHGASKLKDWSERNMGSMLAVAVDGEVVTFAKVAGVLGTKLSMCLPGERLEDAERLADALSGTSR